MGGNDTFSVNGNGMRVTWYKPDGDQSAAGTFVIRKSTSSPIRFINIESTKVVDFWKAHLVTPNSADTTAVNPVAAGNCAAEISQTGATAVTPAKNP
jgi:hypothetical protein